jgi:hypothetical protein
VTANTDLREALNAIYTGEPQKCPMAKVLDTFDEDTKIVVEKSLFDPDFPYSRLHKELRRAGIKISSESVSDHRKGICVCREN